MAHVQYPGAFTGRTPGQGESELSYGASDGLYAPDDTARKRLDRYEMAEQMLNPEEHLKARRTEALEQPNANDRYWIPLDLGGMLTRLMRHYTLGEEFAVRAQLRGQLPSGDVLLEQQAEAQSVVDRITKQSNLEHLLRQVSEQLPALGDAVLRVDLKDAEDPEDGQVVPTASVRYVRPHYYFPKLDPTDATNVLGVTLAWTVADPREGRSTKALVLREEHTVGQVSYSLNEFDGRQLGASVPIADAFPGYEDHATGIDEIPVVHFGFNTKAGEHFGNSEVLRVKRVILALENRLAQEDEVLEKHARPKLVVGPGVLDDEGRANLADFDIIEVTPDVFEKAVKPDYLTWDMQVQGIQHEIEKLEEYLFMTTETSPASFGLERDGSQVESARALRFKAHRTVNKVHDVRTGITPGIESVYRIAQKLELAERKRQGVGTGYRRCDVSVRYGDPIVEDQAQEVMDYVARKSAGLVSRRRAIMDLDNLSLPEAQSEVEEILQDQVDEAAAMTATLQPLETPSQEAPPTELEREPEPEPEPEPANPNSLKSEEGLGVGEDIQKVILNGAQVTSMVTIVKEVAAGTLPRDSALAIIQTAFGLDAAKSEELLGSAGTDAFKLPEKATAPPAFLGNKAAKDAVDEEDGGPVGEDEDEDADEDAEA